MGSIESVVWIVTVEGEPSDAVIGVFGDADAAESFASDAAERYGRDILTRGYPMNWERVDPSGVFFSTAIE